MGKSSGDYPRDLDDDDDSVIKSYRHTDKVKKRYADFTRRLHRACSNRALFVTAKGYVGLAPWNARKGDVVTILLGGKTPYLLRRQSPDASLFTLVGEAYVHGVMEGEVMVPETSPLIQRIAIV